MASQNGSNEVRLQEAIAAYFQDQENGPVDREAFLARYPDLADELRAFFADHDTVLPRMLSGILRPGFV